MLLGVVSPAVHVFKAPLGGDGLGGLEPRAGVRDEADPGEDLIRLDHDLIGAVDPLYPRRTIPERRIDAGLPEIGRFEHVRVRRENHRRHRHLLSDLIASGTFGNQPIAVKLSAVAIRARLSSWPAWGPPGPSLLSCARPESAPPRRRRAWADRNLQHCHQHAVHCSKAEINIIVLYGAQE